MRHNKSASTEHEFSILTVDDDPIMTATLQAYFQRSGYRVDVENDPVRAVERIRTGQYDILLLDFLMTPICGDQVVEQVRQFDQDIFIVLLTGHKSMAPPIKTIRSLDIQGYYEKNDRFDQLELLVESCAKAIRQMRTIRGYKDGLATVVERLSQLYQVQKVDEITDRSLQTVLALPGCIGASIRLSACWCGEEETEENTGHFISRTLGVPAGGSDDGETKDLLRGMGDRPFLTREKLGLFPLVDEGMERFGLLEVMFQKSPTQDQLQVLEVFSRQMAAAVAHARLHAELQKKTRERDQAYDKLNDSYLEMVQAMRQVVDAKDIYTRGHSDRVSYYAQRLALALGRDEAYCERIRVAGLFHDVGKLSIPDEILMKDSKLTDEEYEVIKTHPQNGVKILSVITQFRDILPAVLSHHERFDGTGYPEGKRGMEIPEQARMIAVADSFDAMTSDRKYRKSLGFERAVQELKDGMGTQFDPQMAEAFIGMIEQPEFWQELCERAPSQMASEVINILNRRAAQ